MRNGEGIGERVIKLQRWPTVGEIPRDGTLMGAGSSPVEEGKLELKSSGGWKRRSRNGEQANAAALPLRFGDDEAALAAAAAFMSGEGRTPDGEP